MAVPIHTKWFAALRLAQLTIPSADNMPSVGLCEISRGAILFFAGLQRFEYEQFACYAGNLGSVGLAWRHARGS